MTSTYVGSELDLFAEAVHWKRYVAAVLTPYIGGRVAEIGAGIGSNIPYFRNPLVSEWLCVEPDPALAARISKAATGVCTVHAGTLHDIESTRRFDTILYIDVLEHIRDDAAEFAAAAARLASGGHLIVLAPAHQSLFSPFDTAIGHYRRYDRGSIVHLPAAAIGLVSCRYLDCVGYFASLANRLLLRAAMPTRGQIALWDRLFVPLSRCLDPLLGYRFGKTVIGIWKAP